MIPTQGWPQCVRDLHKITMRGLMCSALQLPSSLASILHLIHETEDHPLCLMVAWLALADE